jgi:hypothetical protein
MVRYIFVAGVFAAAVLAAPAQDAAEVGAAPAGWGDNSPSLGEALFGWGKSKPSKPAAVAVEEASPSTWYTPPSSSSSGIWGSLFGGNRGDRENKGGSGAGSSASTPSSSDWGSRFGGNKGGSGADISAPPKSSPGGGFFSGIFGASRPKPASSGPPSGSSWGRPKPDSTKPKPESSESSEQNASPWSWLRPKPDSSKPKPEEWPATPEPKPASSESSDEAESSASTPASKPEPAQPKPETAVPVPVPAPLEPKPEPVQPKPETAAPAPVPTPVQPKPKPAEPKPETEAIPKPTTSSSDSICGPNSLEPASDDIETIRKRLWQPKIGSKWQIILDGVPDTKRAVLKPEDATIFDIDLWDAHADHICDLKKRGKKVICYFSAGTSEEWRKAPEYPDGDFKELKAYNKGQICADLESNGKGCKKYWGGEQWVDITSNKVWQIMAKRIKMAADKGCDALDPDNMGESLSIDSIG